MGKTRDYNGLADYIIQEEGFLDKPTNIGDGKITLGSGLTDPKWHNLYKQRGNKWSKEDNKKAVIEEIKMREKILADSFPNWDKLPIDSQNALISYKYNYNFTPSNSPKLYQAARDFNYLNMAAQMDATSKDPKFRKGLMERRKREQEMFLSGFPSGRSIVRATSPAVEQPDATTVYNPYPVQLEYTKPAPVMVPDEDSYVTAHRLTDSEIKAQQIQEKFDAINRYNALMDSISVQNNPTPQYKPQNAPYVIAPYAEGGFIQPKDAWDKLSLQEKSAMMRAAVRQGIYNLKDIRQKYNEFAEGGSKEGEEVGITDGQYLNTMEKVAEENYKNWGYNNSDEALVHALNDNTYNYRGYYNKYPQSAANADTHWTDEFKTVYHPTFSNESIYSGQKSKYNPLGLPGGFWIGEDKTASFIPMAWQTINNQYKSGGSIHIKPSHRGRLTELKERTGKSEAELYNDGNPAHKKMVVFARNARKWKHGDGGNLFDGGGNTQASDYRYIQNEDGQWSRVTNDDMGRVFQGLAVTPNRTKIKYVPERIDNSEQGIKQRENFFLYRNNEGNLRGEPGLEITSPEFEILGAAPLIKEAIKKGAGIYNNYLDIKALKEFNSKYGYTAVKPKYSLAFDSKKLDNVFDYTVNRHNTFVRGVNPYRAHKDGKLLDMEPEEAARYSMTHIPKATKGNNHGLLPDENALYVSNDYQTAYRHTDGGEGYIGIVRRPIKYGQTTRREFLKDNDFIFSRIPGRERQFFHTTDDPNIPWVTKDYSLSDSPTPDWSTYQPFEIRANDGAKIIEKGDPNFRHYMFVGNVGEEPVELIKMFKPTIHPHQRTMGALSFSRKKEYGGLL